MSYQLHHGDALEVLQSLPAHSADALVTDPPSGIAFMGADWDTDKGGRAQWVAWLAAILVECRRVCRPGAHALIWALPRRSHWTATAVEDAGWQIRDVITHHFGTGFPKSLSLGEGRGTALKSASEHWILARAPLAEETIAANVHAHGTGALNIDACRIGTDPVGWGGAPSNGYSGGRNSAEPGGRPAAGRWPANVLFDETMAAELDRQSGVSRSGGYPPAGGMRSQVATYGVPNVRGEQRFGGSDGGASRFFYVAKPSRAERDHGLGDLSAASAGVATHRQEGSAGLNSPRAGAGRTGGARNVHPTVKPIRLMQYLVRLVTPPGGTVFDPFMGSGTTGIACLREGSGFLGIEREGEYIEIARHRLAAAAREMA